jgi:hypothetical protein
MPRRHATALTLAVSILVAIAPAQTEADPLDAALDASDARRFAAVFKASDGAPDAAALQAGYLDGAGRGVAVFTPYRIENAANLASAVQAKSADYRHAIETCLPLVDSLQAELRAVALAYAGLLPERPFPEVHVVFGAGTSGGTAQPGVQVVGLEVMCGQGTTPETFREGMRMIFAHETVHAWQPEQTPASFNDLLLFFALREGTPDLLASIVTGRVPDAARHEWALPREAELWREFQADAAAITEAGRDAIDSPESQARVRRWFYNAGSPPEGWPQELGYWVGMRIGEAYLAKVGAVTPAERRAAIERLIAVQDAPALLAASGYAPMD